MSKPDSSNPVWVLVMVVCALGGYAMGRYVEPEPPKCCAPADPQHCSEACDCVPPIPVDVRILQFKLDQWESFRPQYAAFLKEYEAYVASRCPCPGPCRCAGGCCK